LFERQITGTLKHWYNC